MRLHLLRSAKCSLSLLCLAALIGLAGCSGKKGPKAEVNGKVTLAGKDVGGDIIFVSADGKEFKSPISKGVYQIIAAPPGKYKVAVTPLLGAGSGPKPGVVPMNTGGKDAPAMVVESLGVTPPAKYAKAESSGLEYEVTDGKQTKDFELK